VKITGIEHISINIRDIQKSRDFYTQIMGFNYLEMVDCGDFDIHYYSIPGGARLELFDYRGISKDPSRDESEVGLRHLAFLVEDVAAHEKLLREAGVEITLSTCDLPNLRARVCLFVDPNGMTLEFCEKL
jgi:catechol 2,3-dioxygenase-like lactoylglutathione lyase family enzyme